jgi:predicted metallopeptidase
MINYIITFDINVTFLIDVVEKYQRSSRDRGISRAFDILGAKKRLLEYELALFIKLRKERDWEIRFEKRLPASFFGKV